MIKVGTVFDIKGINSYYGVIKSIHEDLYTVEWRLIKINEKGKRLIQIDEFRKKYVLRMFYDKYWRIKTGIKVDENKICKKVLVLK